MRKLLSVLLFAAWPAAFLGGLVYEGWSCGWNRSVWEDAVCKSPLKARPHLSLGQRYYAANQMDPAMLEFAKALELSKANRYHQDREWGIIAETNIAIILMKRGEWTEADQLLQKITAGAPDYYVAWNALAYVFAVGGNPEEALRITDQILSKDRSWMLNASIYYHRGVAFHALKRCVEANAHYARARELDDRINDLPLCVN